MGAVANAYDKSMAESLVSALKRGLIHRHSWPNRQMARTAIFEYIGGFYNLRRDTPRWDTSAPPSTRKLE
jgi:putative transposase